MQTIARANRRAVRKSSGVIVDYIGVFNNLKRALGVYAGGGEEKPDECPNREKTALVAALGAALDAARAFADAAGAERPDRQGHALQSRARRRRLHPPLVR